MAGAPESFGKFQSAPPVKGAIQKLVRTYEFTLVSIRAPREGGDNTHFPLMRILIRFNPRPP